MTHAVDPTTVDDQPKPANGGTFKILTDAEHVFAKLRRKTGETLQAFSGEIVQLFEGEEPDESHSEVDRAVIEAANDAHAAAIAAHVEAGQIEPAPGAKPDPWPREVEVVVDEAKAAAEAAVAEQARQHEAQVEQDAAEQAALAQKQLADQAAGAQQAQDAQNPPADVPPAESIESTETPPTV